MMNVVVDMIFPEGVWVRELGYSNWLDTQESLYVVVGSVGICSCGGSVIDAL